MATIPEVERLLDKLEHALATEAGKENPNPVRIRILEKRVEIALARYEEFTKNRAAKLAQKSEQQAADNEELTKAVKDAGLDAAGIRDLQTALMAEKSALGDLRLQLAEVEAQKTEAMLVADTFIKAWAIACSHMTSSEGKEFLTVAFVHAKLKDERLFNLLGTSEFSKITPPKDWREAVAVVESGVDCPQRRYAIHWLRVSQSKPFTELCEQYRKEQDEKRKADAAKDGEARRTAIQQAVEEQRRDNYISQHRDLRSPQAGSPSVIDRVASQIEHGLDPFKRIEGEIF